MANYYTETECTSKKGIRYINSSIFGRCKLLSKEQITNEIQDNECLEKCDNIPKSKYKFYIDTEVCQYYAVPK